MVRFTTILITALREEKIADLFQDPAVPDIVSALEALLILKLLQRLISIREVLASRLWTGRRHAHCAI